MSFMLDTCILIHMIRKKDRKLIEIMRRKPPNEVCVSSVTVAEMEYGAAKSACPDRNRDALYQFLSPIEVLPFDETAAFEYGLIRAHLERKGAVIGAMDMMIAAHGRSIRAVIVTDNVEEFKRAPGLTVENWLRP